MPMSADFERRLTALLPDLVDGIGTPVHVYDEVGIRQTCEMFAQSFEGVPGREFFAVKALPNRTVMRMLAGYGFGFDTCSTAEIALAETVGATGSDICFTSYNTSPAELAAAVHAGALVTVDDAAVLATLADLGGRPDTVAVRVNPGRLHRTTDNHLFGDPEEMKFGVPADHLVKVCRQARDIGVRELGLHMMMASNVLRPEPLLLTLDLLLELAQRVGEEVGLPVTSLNLGGGIGIPYRPDEQPFDLPAFGSAVRQRLDRWPGTPRPAIRFECGRYVTGPHGVIVTRVVNRMEKWRTFVGVDASSVALMRPAMYPWAYHHITALTVHGGQYETVDVVGSLPENGDRLGRTRELPVLSAGDVLLVHDTGAHGHAMTYNYTSRPRPPEVLLRADGSAELIRRGETQQDLFATLDFVPHRVTPRARRAEAV